MENVLLSIYKFNFQEQVKRLSCMTNTWKEQTMKANYENKLCKKKILGSTDAISVPWTGVED